MSDRFTMVTDGIGPVREAVFRYMVTTFPQSCQAESALRMYTECMLISIDSKSELTIRIEDMTRVSNECLGLFQSLSDMLPCMSAYKIKRFVVTVLAELVALDKNVQVLPDNMKKNDLHTLWDAMIARLGAYPDMQLDKVSLDELGVRFATQVKTYSRLKKAADSCGLGFSHRLVQLLRVWMAQRNFCGKIHTLLSDSRYPMTPLAKLYSYYRSYADAGEITPDLPDLLFQWPESLYPSKGEQDELLYLQLLWDMVGHRVVFPLAYKEMHGDLTMKARLQEWKKQLSDTELPAPENVPQDPEMFVRFLSDHGDVVFPGTTLGERVRKCLDLIDRD